MNITTWLLMFLAAVCSAVSVSMRLHKLQRRFWQSFAISQIMTMGATLANTAPVQITFLALTAVSYAVSGIFLFKQAKVFRLKKQQRTMPDELHKEENSNDFS